MSFDDKIELPSSNKFYMVRIQGGKLLTKNNTTHVATVFDPILGANFQVFEAYIQKNLTIKSFFTNSSSSALDYVVTQVDEWQSIRTGGVAPYYQTFSYNPETGYIKLSSPLISATTIQDYDCLIIEYYLFFTQFSGKRAPLDMDAGTEVYWQPRLPKDFSIGADQANALAGQLSVSTNTLELNNYDLYFNDFFGDHDSFNNREVKCWRCVDEVATKRFDFSGVIRGASLNDQKCSFELNDILSVLDVSYYAGNTGYKFYSDMVDNVDYIIRGDDQSRPVYRLIGKTSPYDVFYYNTSTSLQTRLLTHETGLMVPATCVNYNAASKITSTNRKWSCGFGPASAANDTFTCSGVLTQIIDDYHASRITLTVNAEDYFSVGDTFKLGTKYGIVSGVVGNSIYSWPENPLFAAGVMTLTKCPGVVIVNQDGVKFYPKGIQDYTCSIGPKGDLQITFVNNFEAGYSGMGTLDPDSFEVFVKFKNPTVDSKASTITKAVLTEAGLSCSATFMPDQTPVWPDPNLCFTIPFIGQSSYPSCSDVVEACLKSANAFIYLDSNGEFRYKSFLDGIQSDPADIDNQSGIDPTDGISQKTSSEFSATFDLYDQYIGTKFNLTHAPNSTSFYVDYNQSYSFGGDSVSVSASRLYKTNKYYEVDSVIDPHNNNGLPDSTFLQKYNDLMIGRRAEYSLKVFSRHFKLYIGDDILVSRTKLTGGLNENYMRVIAISKASDDMTVKFLDLKRFPK